MGVSAVSSWEARERSLQVRRDALCSVGIPHCSKVRVMKVITVLIGKSPNKVLLQVAL